MVPNVSPSFTPFQEAVHRVVQLVPPGRVITYADVARVVGRPGASRAVGTVMRTNPDTRVTPCHRVVRTDGTVGWYGGGAEFTRKKVGLLKAEGVPVKPDGTIERFEEIRWVPRRTA